MCGIPLQSLAHLPHLLGSYRIQLALQHSFLIEMAGKKPQTRAAAADAKGNSPVPLGPSSPMGRRTVRNTPMAAAGERGTLSPAGAGASGSNKKPRSRPNVAGAQRSQVQGTPVAPPAANKQLDVAAMLAAVKEEPPKVGVVSPPMDVEEKAGIEPNVQPHDAGEGVDSFKLKRREYTKPRSQRSQRSQMTTRSQSSTRPVVGQLRPKGAPLAGPQVKTTSIEIVDEDTVSDKEGMEAAANLEEVQQVQHQHQGIIEVSSTGVPGGLGTLDKNMKLWSSR